MVSIMKWLYGDGVFRGSFQTRYNVCVCTHHLLDCVFLGCVIGTVFDVVALDDVLVDVRLKERDELR